MSYQDTKPNYYSIGEDVKIVTQCYADEYRRGWSYLIGGFVGGLRTGERYGYASEEEAIKEAKRVILSQSEAIKKNCHDQIQQLGRLQELILNNEVKESA